MTDVGGVVKLSSSSLPDYFPLAGCFIPLIPQKPLLQKQINMKLRFAAVLMYGLQYELINQHLLTNQFPHNIR